MVCCMKGGGKNFAARSGAANFLEVGTLNTFRQQIKAFFQGNVMF